MPSEATLDHAQDQDQDQDRDRDIDDAAGSTSHSSRTPPPPPMVATSGAEALKPPAPAIPSIAETGTHSQESERMVISLMLNPARVEIHHKLMQLLAPDDFFVDQNKTIWTIISSLRDAGLPSDAVSVIDHAATHDSFVGGAAYVVDAVNDPIAKFCSDEAGLAAANRIKGFALLRRLHKSLATGVTLCMAGQSFEQVADYVEDDLINLKRSASSSRNGPQQVGIYYDAILAQIDAKERGIETTDTVATGFPELDKLLGGGLMKAGLTVLAGRPAMGKSAFATAIEENISMSRPTLVFSLEMPGKQLAQRNLSRHARIPLSRVKTVDFIESDYSKLVESIELLSKRPCFIDDTPGLTSNEIRSRARTFAEKYPDLVIILDYLQIVQSTNPKADGRQAVTEASKAMLQLALELKCPVLALAQLNRDLEKRANKRPIMADLKESGQIEQDAAVILFVYRDEVYNPDTPDRGITEIIVGKNRDGATDTVRFASTLETMHYQELGRYGSQN